VLSTDAIAYGESMAAWGAAQEREKIEANAVSLSGHFVVPADDVAELARLRSELAACKEDAERYRKGHERYETARLLHPQQWKEAWLLNRNTGKPFDEIIDDLRTFGSAAIDKARKA
jgi:hypothetical protein